MQRGATSRQVPWPREVALVARSLARDGAWFWLDGEAQVPGEAAGRSYLGSASDVRRAERGREHEFLRMLRGEQTVGRGERSPEFLGWVTALSYEFGVALLGLTPQPDDVVPGFALAVSTVLILDHGTGRAELSGESEAALESWLDRHGASLGAKQMDTAHTDAPDSFPGPAGSAIHTESPGSAATTEARAQTWRRTEHEYRDQVAACRAAIVDGDAYVLCLTDRATVHGRQDPLSLYLKLRLSGASSRGGVIVAGERALVSASPERFLAVSAGRVTTHPIKGTRPRGANARADAALATELAADPKERAENLMIVDLMRNDLSRICDPNTVATSGFLRVETHPHVHQLVSTVSGRLRSGLDAIDAIAACFPGGSMTGAPKRRAVELLAEIEGEPRGLYSGCFGWIAGGEAELAMTIRSIELRGLGTSSVTAFVGAGGGITADSDPASEERERRLKAAPLLEKLAR
ncbi:anthranilate synthase component I family protein [Leucobacter sp. W1038]|uniref:anthranilate synthase component I family protein n=1 Tax=Leucobacter sp. W1038 TaxID=3438281 RepID=UPI003D99B6D6